MYYIYAHINKINGKVYVGETSLEPRVRWKGGKGYKRNIYFNNAIHKYGWDNFDHIILESNVPEDKVEELENYYINLYDSRNREKGYNIKEGGLHGKHSDETRNKMSEQRKGVNHPNYGKHLSEETRQKISDAKKGIPNRNKGKHFMPEESKQVLREKNTGENSPVAKKVLCLTTNQIFPTLTAAAEWCGLKSSSNIGKCCRGEAKTAGKHPETKERLRWAYTH